MDGTGPGQAQDAHPGRAWATQGRRSGWAQVRLDDGLLTVEWRDRTAVYDLGTAAIDVADDGQVLLAGDPDDATVGLSFAHGQVRAAGIGVALLLLAVLAGLVALPGPFLPVAGAAIAMGAVTGLLAWRRRVERGHPGRLALLRHASAVGAGQLVSDPAHPQAGPQRWDPARPVEVATRPGRTTSVVATGLVVGVVVLVVAAPLAQDLLDGQPVDLAGPLVGAVVISGIVVVMRRRHRQQGPPAG